MSRYAAAMIVGLVLNVGGLVLFALQPSNLAAVPTSIVGSFFFWTGFYGPRPRRISEESK